MDNYDIQIEQLSNWPEDIYQSWNVGEGIFKKIGEEDYHEANNYSSGCLTQIRAGKSKYGTMRYKAFINHQIDEALTKEIKADKRIPKDPCKITPKDLPVFAQWQRRIDKLQEQALFT